MANNRAVISNSKSTEASLQRVIRYIGYYLAYQKAHVAKYQASKSPFKRKVEDKRDELLAIQNILHKATVSNWQQLVQVELKNMEFDEKSQTLQFLNHLLRNDLLAARNMIKDEQNKNPELVVKYTEKVPTAFTVSDVDADTAQMLAHQFFSRQDHVATKSAKLETVNSFQTHTDQQKFVLLGHGSVDSFGSYSAQEFAKVFAKRFAEANSDAAAKAKSIDLYLIGCEIGREVGRHESFAQKMANELYAKGFTNLVVHSAYRKHQDDSLIVEVITKPGLLSFMVEKGFISAKSYTKAQSDRLDELQKDPKKNKLQIAKLHHEVKAVYMHPQDMLDQPENIFKPNQTSQQRQADIVTQKAQQRENALQVLRQKLAELEGNFVRIYYQARINYLQNVIALVEKAGLDTWASDLAQYLKNNREDWMAKDSTTYQCLLAVANTQFDKAAQFVKPAVTTDSANQAITAQSQLRVHLNSIKYLIDELNKEIAALKKTTYWFSIFKKFETNTKLKKVEALQSMVTVDSLEKLQEKAKENLDVRRVRWSLKTERTKDLLERICSLR